LSKCSPDGQSAKEIHIHGSHLRSYCYPPVLEWMANKRISEKGVVIHKFALDDFQKGFETAGKADDSIKVVLVPSNLSGVIPVVGPVSFARWLSSNLR